jgi:hypothetical protein
MTELEKRKEQLNTEIEKYKNWLRIYESELNEIKSLTQPQDWELYDGIEKFFTYVKESKSFEFVLGGDGRSKPWSEQRTGNVFIITLNEGVWLSDVQKQMLKDYVKEKYSPDDIQFK